MYIKGKSRLCNVGSMSNIGLVLCLQIAADNLRNIVYGMPCCAVLCFAVLRYAMLCYAKLGCAITRCVMPCCTTTGYNVWLSLLCLLVLCSSHTL